MTRLYIAGTSGEVRGDGSGRLDGLLGRDGEVTGLTRVLESFYYVRDWQTECIGEFRGFMLDSGAYTLCYGSKRVVDLDRYADAYGRYVRDNGVRLYFELDVDDAVGTDAALSYRREIEGCVGRPCIPVWHACRGHGEWLRMCDEYGYVAIGGIADKGRSSIEPLVPGMVREAHERGAMVHGLGYARAARLGEMGFDSVDSASWTWGLKRNFLFSWDGSRMGYHGFRRKDLGDVSMAEVHRHNFMEWLRMSLDLEHGDGASDAALGPGRVLTWEEA